MYQHAPKVMNDQLALPLIMTFRIIEAPAPERTMGDTQYGAGCGRLRCYFDRIGGIGWCGVHRLAQPAGPAWLG